MKRKGDISSFFLPKRRPTNEQRDASGELLIEREQQGSEKVEDKDDQGDGEVEEGEHHRDEKRKKNV